MLFRFLLFAVLVALWWGALWFMLPVGWLQGAMPAFIAIHLAPPLLAVAAWWMGKRAWIWRAKRAEKRAEEVEDAGKKAAEEAAKVAHHEAQELRRVHVDCRAVWASAIKVPDWFGDGAGQCFFLEQNPSAIQGTGREAALASSLKALFENAFSQCEACVWLPVAFAADDPMYQVGAEQAWHQAVKEKSIEHFPQRPDFVELPGDGEIPDRLIALFEQVPDLPAVILVGMDSPLAEAPELEISDPQIRPGHAVVAMLLSRPGLTAPAEAEPVSSEDGADSMTPYWERENSNDADAPQWQRIPPPLRSFLWNYAPFATLHRTSTVVDLEPKRDSVLIRQIRETILEACINAGLRDLPFEAQETAKDGKAQAKPVEIPAEPEPLDLGWFVHNCALPIRLGALSSALRDHGCEISPLKEASHLDKEHGNVGAVRDALMLAEALIRVEQLQKPVLTAGFNNDNSLCIGLICPFSEPIPTEHAPTEPA